MKLLIALSIMLASCSTTTVPITKKFPELPPILREECSELVKVTGTSIIDLIEINIENYRRGVECRVKRNAFIEWYTEQKKIVD